ncbi:MAG: 4-alpha-glucanotransferase, partial [Chloroflexota bacterium]|nr:4-alpha-glucanotransferase [Chloroflexota bacterium]
LEHLRYDAYERRSGLVRILLPDTTPEAAAAGTAAELADLRDGTWALERLEASRIVVRRAGHVRMGVDLVPVDAFKTISIGGGRLDPSLDLDLEIAHVGGRQSPPIDALIGIEWSTMLLGGGHNPAAWHDVGAQRIAHDETTRAADVSRLAAGNDQLGVSVETTIDRPVDVWIAPIQTVSNSEAGFELVYQGAATLLVAPLKLAAGERLNLRIRQLVTVRGERFGGGGADDRPARVRVEVESGRR